IATYAKLSDPNEVISLFESMGLHYEQNGDLVPDPDMVFYTGYGVENGWVSVHYQGNTGYYQVATKIEDGQVEKFYPHAQAEQASFANMWARNLQAQGFVHLAQAA